MKKETIYLAGGCFWGTEKYMEMVPGVLSTRVGYALGKQKGVEQKVWDTVTYEEVCNHSGHAETVEVSTPSTPLLWADRGQTSASSTAPAFTA